MRTTLHPYVTGNDDLSAVIRKSLQPRHVIPRSIIVIASFWRIVGCRFDYEASRYFSKLPFVGEGLQDPHNTYGNILVKCDLQAATARFSSNLTASRTCRTGRSKMSATN